MEKIALVAGNGNLPYFFYETAQKKGYSVYPVGLFPTVNKKLQKTEKYISMNIGEIGRFTEFLKENDIKKVIMLGKVEKSIIYSDLSLDRTLRKIVDKLPDRKDETLLLGIVSHLREEGVEILPQSFLMDKLMAEEKIYTVSAPDENDEKTIKIGLEAARMLGKLDVGQTVVVKNMSVVALEAVEGTDETIKRAELYAGADTILVKTSRPQQDMRVDVPAIGLRTLETAIQAKVKGIVIEAGKVIFMDKEEVVKMADEHGIFIAGVKL